MSSPAQCIPPTHGPRTITGPSRRTRGRATHPSDVRSFVVEVPKLPLSHPSHPSNFSDEEVVPPCPREFSLSKSKIYRCKWCEDARARFLLTDDSKFQDTIGTEFEEGVEDLSQLARQIAVKVDLYYPELPCCSRTDTTHTSFNIQPYKITRVQNTLKRNSYPEPSMKL